MPPMLSALSGMTGACKVFASLEVMRQIDDPVSNCTLARWQRPSARMPAMAVSMSLGGTPVFFPAADPAKFVCPSGSSVEGSTDFSVCREVWCFPAQVLPASHCDSLLVCEKTPGS